MNKAVVKPSSGTTLIVGKSTVLVPMDCGAIVEAYLAPEFDTNIMSVMEFSEFYNVSITRDPPAVAKVST